MVTLSEILGQRFLDQNTLTEGNYAYCIHTDTSTLGITIIEMQKLFCHKIENVPISRFLCVIFLSRKAFCAVFYACMPACYNEKVKSAVLPQFLFLQDGQEEGEDCVGKSL